MGETGGKSEAQADGGILVRISITGDSDIIKPNKVTRKRKFEGGGAAIFW